MADTFDKVTSNTPRVIPARTWNALLEAGQDFQRRKLAGGGGGPMRNDPLNPAVRVLVRNDTGSDLDPGAVVALGTPIVSAADYPRAVAQSPLFPGTVPAAVTDAFAVLLDPLADEEIGRAVIMGVATCSVNVAGATDTYATPKAGDETQLESAATGPARILWREAGSSGTKKALVQLAGYSPASGPSASTSAWKEPVRVASRVNGNITTGFEAGDTVDGVLLVAGDRILIKNQTTGYENGIYIVGTGAPARAGDFNTSALIVGGLVHVVEGTKNKDTIWQCTNDAPVTVGTTPIVFDCVHFPFSRQTSDTYSYTSTGAGTAVIGTFTISVPGTYRFQSCANLLGLATASGVNPASLAFYIRDVTNGIPITEPENVQAFPLGVDWLHMASIEGVYTYPEPNGFGFPAYPATIEVRVERFDGTWTSSYGGRARSSAQLTNH